MLLTKTKKNKQKKMVLLNTAHYKELNEKRKALHIYTSVLEGLLNILTASSMMRDLWEMCIISLCVFTLII